MLRLLKLCPVFVLLLGFCPTLAVTTSVGNALGMGIAFTFVLIFSNLFISLLRTKIPNELRIPLFILIAVTFVSITEMLMAGFAPDLYKALGIFIPLIVVNCIILGRAETFASKNPWWPSVLDALINGAGFTGGLLFLACIRELVGNGTLLGIHLMPTWYQPIIIFILPPGAFLLIGIILALMAYDRAQTKAS